MVTVKPLKRFWEIDFARGAAVLAMLAFNWQFALYYFGLYEFNPSAGFWWFFARGTAAAFVFFVGVSLSISFAGTSGKPWATENKLREKYLRRGAKLFGLGVLTTLATWLFMESGFVVFGVLHLVGLSIILAYPFLRLPGRAVFIGGSAAVLAGMLLFGQRFEFPWLLWLGFVPKGFYSIDYLPVLPWFGVALLGLAFGKTIYPAAKRRFEVPELGGSVFARPVCFLGRHSLAVYMLHQPLLVGALYFAGIPFRALNIFP